MAEEIIPTNAIDDEEYIGTIAEDVVIAGVESLNGETGELNLKTINGEELLGEGDIEITSGVSSINGQTGDVTLTASDLGAASSDDLADLSMTVAGKQDELTTTQMNAVNSGIDSNKVGQITTNTQLIDDEKTARQNVDVSLQAQIDGIAASSDVTDIVGTKAQLNAYDTSKLNNNDIVKVLQDESQNGETTYYRWSTTTQTFTLIGEEGPYYTKSEADVLLNTKVDKVTGYGLSENNFSDSDVTKLGGIESGAEVNEIDSISVNGTPVTPDANRNVDLTISSGPTVVQTTGTSTTDVMSQSATTGMVFSDPSAQTRVQIGSLSSASSWDAIAIGERATASNGAAIAIGGGYQANMTTLATGLSSIAIGMRANASAQDSIAFGYGAMASAKGEMNIGSNVGNGYNSSGYRLLTGLYDPQSAHDAATKGYVDGIVGNIESALQIINNGSSNS